MGEGLDGVVLCGRFRGAGSCRGQGGAGFGAGRGVVVAGLLLWLLCALFSSLSWFLVLVLLMVVLVVVVVVVVLWVVVVLLLGLGTGQVVEDLVAEVWEDRVMAIWVGVGSGLRPGSFGRRCGGKGALGCHL